MEKGKGAGNCSLVRHSAVWKAILLGRLKGFLWRRPGPETDAWQVICQEGIYLTSAPHIILLRNVSKKIWLKRFTTLMV